MRDFIKSIAAGIIIGLCVTVYCICEIKFIGAILFAFGLIAICSLDLNLYTGKVGYMDKNSFLYIIGNFIGTMITMLPQYSRINCTALVLLKLSQPIYLTLFLAFACGVIMFIAVEIYKRKNNYLGIIFGVPLFIMCGFEHSIADICYFLVSNCFGPQAVFFIFTVIIGNALGAIFMNLISKKSSVKT